MLPSSDPLPTSLTTLFSPALLSEIKAVARPHQFRQGDVLIEPGQPMAYIPIVLSGCIKILRPDGDSEVLLYYLRATDACALSVSSLLTNEQRSIRAIADEPTQVLMIPARQAQEWLGQFADWRQFIFQTYQKRFDDLLDTFDSVAFSQLDERLVAYLNRKAALVGGRHLYLTHDEIARDLNTSREGISRLLKQLERRGQVLLARNKISLLTPV